MSASFELAAPSRVTIGTVGRPGQRTFYLQARQDDQLVSLKMEKQQVLLLARGLQEVLADLAAPGTPSDELELEEPVLAEWAVGTMQLAYDQTNDRIVLLAIELGAGEGEPEAEEEEEEELEALDPELFPPGEPAAGLEGQAAGGAGGMARFAMTRDQAAGLARRGEDLVQAGRPPCPLCGFPLGEDHSCPKTNGHRPPAL